MNSVMTGFADRVASLVPGALVAADAKAASSTCYYTCALPATCNGGEFIGRWSNYCCITQYGVYEFCSRTGACC